MAIDKGKIPSLGGTPESIVVGLRVRIALLGTICIFLSLFIASRYIPFQFYWLLVFDTLHFHQYWPWLILLATICFPVGGLWSHHKYGLGQFSPVLATNTILVFLFLVVVLLTDTAADWSVGWCIVVSGILLLAVLVMTFSLIAHTELWRLLANPSVVSYVYKALVDGRFRKKTLRRSLEKIWGSLHCLRIVQGRYDDTKQKVLQSINNVIRPEDLEAYLNAGEDLWLYLSVRWPEQLMKPVEQSWRIVELLRELITICLLAGQQNRFIARTNRWISLLRDDADPYRQLLMLIFQISRGTRTVQTFSDMKTIINEVVHLFEDLPLEGRMPNGSKIELREICAHTWLALAHHGLPKQACFDVWMAMRERQTQDLFVSPDTAGECDPAKVAARRFLADWYSEWRDQTPAPWNQGLAGRAVYAQELATLAAQQWSDAPSSQ